MNPLKRLALAAAAAAVLASSPAFAQKTMRIAHLNPDSPFESHSGAMAAVFKNLVETGTNGSVKVQLFPNGQLGKDNEVIQQVRDGVVESVISSSGGVASHYKMVGVFDLPFAFPNITVANRVLDVNSDFGKKFSADLQAKTGLKVLGLLDSGGFFAISNNKRPITSAADMAGLRIRTMTLPTHEAIIRSLGGQPTALPWAEVYTALQTGVADGQMNPVPIIAFAKFDEVQKFLSITNHVLTPYFWFVNAEVLRQPDARGAQGRRAGRRNRGRSRARDFADHRGIDRERHPEAGQEDEGEHGVARRDRRSSPRRRSRRCARSSRSSSAPRVTAMLNAMLADIEKNNK